MCIRDRFPPLDGPVQHYAASGINRSFLVSTPRELRLCYGTTADVMGAGTTLTKTGDGTLALGYSGNTLEMCIRDR